jgi:hypothetical protein
LVQRRENSAAAQEEESPGAGQEDENARQQQEGQEIPAQGTGLRQYLHTKRRSDYQFFVQYLYLNRERWIVHFSLDPDHKSLILCTVPRMMRIRITLMRIRILFVTERIRILLVTLLRIRTTFHFDADPVPSLQLKVQNLAKVLK